MKSRKNNQFIASIVREWWWVFLFLAFSYSTYYSLSSIKSGVYQSLLQRASALTHAREVALSRQDDLRLRIASQSDPEWIEMMLMKALGVVPEGQIKVHFDE